MRHKGYISSIETTGMVDGPGIRLIIFFEGCKLRCKYCHNPETWKETKSNEYSSYELIKVILRYKEYFNSSNGGVTFSGGEPLLQSEFLIEMLRLCKKHNIHTAIDTSGVTDINTEKLEEILNLVDLVMLDIKHINNFEYTSLTGKDIKCSIDFLNLCKKHNKKIWIRSVIVPNYNDSEEYILCLKKFLNGIPNIERIELLPYKNPKLKYESLGLKYNYENKDLNLKILNKLKKLLMKEMLVKL